MFIYLFVCQACFIKKLEHLRHVLQQIVLLHSCAWKSFIIHCSSLYTVTRRCDGRLVQFHLGLQGGVRNACSWTQDTGRSVWFNVCSPVCDVRARTQTCSVQNPCFSPCAWISPHSMEMHFFRPSSFLVFECGSTHELVKCMCMYECMWVMWDNLCEPPTLLLVKMLEHSSVHNSCTLVSPTQSRTELVNCKSVTGYYELNKHRDTHMGFAGVHFCLMPLQAPHLPITLTPKWGFC